MRHPRKKQNQYLLVLRTLDQYQPELPTQTCLQEAFGERRSAVRQYQLVRVHVRDRRSADGLCRRLQLEADLRLAERNLQLIATFSLAVDDVIHTTFDH